MSTGGNSPWMPTSPVWPPYTTTIGPNQWHLFRLLLVNLLRRLGLLPPAPPDEDEPPFASIDEIRAAAVAYAPQRVGEIDHRLGVSQNGGLTGTIA